MNCVIPFTKEIKFDTNIAEILSISLEHDYTVNENELLGNFTISGEYKTHEVSVNREAFEYVLPFSVNLTKPIDVDSLDFAIEDFTYEILNNNTLKVDIEYSIKALEIERSDDIFKKVDEKQETEAQNLLIDAIENPEREVIEDSDNRNIGLPAMEENTSSEEIKEEEKVIMNAINEEENDFVTYHIHIMKENETIDSICTKYNVNTNLLENYNDLKNITFGEKIIIPEIDE